MRPPGPGLGGHCIDRSFFLSGVPGSSTSRQFIELAGKVNTQMPYSAPARLRALNGCEAGLGQLGAGAGRQLKPDVGDVRESPAIRLIELLQGLGAEISYHDPRRRPARRGLDLASIELGDGVLERADIVCVVTAHSGIDYDRIAERAPGGRLPQRRSQGQRTGAHAVTAPLRIGVVGLGYWGPNLARNFSQRPRPSWPGAATPTATGTPASQPSFRRRGSQPSSTTC
jgi:UDP-N-acetyl-D-mannosaminuronate dehydrogenase